MQLKESLASLLTPLGWMGVDLLSFIQLLICFVLGCLVKRTWSRSRKSADQAFLKNQKLNEEAAEQHVDKLHGAEPASPSTPLTSQTLTKKTRQVNAQERKRARKIVEISHKSTSEGKPVKGAPVESVPEPPVAVKDTVEEKKKQRAEKKAEKQRAKNQEQEQSRLAKQVREGDEPNQQCNLEEAQTAVAKVDFSETAEQKHMSGNWDEQQSEEKRVLEGPRLEEREEEQCCEEECVPEVDFSETAEQNRMPGNQDEQQSEEKHVLEGPRLEECEEEQCSEEEHVAEVDFPETAEQNHMPGNQDEYQPQECEDEQCSQEEYVPEEELPCFPDDMQYDTSIQNIDHHTPALHLSKLSSDKDADSTPSTESQPEADGLSDEESPSDHEARSETEAQGLCGIATPELTPRNLEGAEMQWPVMNTPPANSDQACQDMQPDLATANSNQAWVPVAIPIEYLQAAEEGTAIHPACFFNGFWQNSNSETIMIDGAELKFENGPVWTMKESNLNGFTVEVAGEEYRAEVAIGGQQILWSDGDIWTCVGRLQNEPSPLWFQDQSELESIMRAGEGYIASPSEMICMDDVPTMLMSAPQLSSENLQEDDWEECWEWKKKGWCRRGADCEWKHPACRTWQADGPFVEDMEQITSAKRYKNAPDSSGPMICEACA